MNSELPEDVSEFGQVAARSLLRVGGAAGALEAETNPDTRADAGRALADLGIDELDVRGDIDDLLAGAALCRSAGSVLLPYPVVESLLAVDGRLLSLIDPDAPRVDHGDLPAEWIAVDLDGVTYDVTPGARTKAKLGPFLVPADLSRRDDGVDPGDVDLHLILGSWRILGSVETALAQVTAHVRERIQFGKRLSDFQTVRFTLADATVAVRGFYELAKFTTSRARSGAAETRACDALVLRLHAVETARAILRTAHQLYGASGFCDETDVSVIDRHLQATLRHPAGDDALARRLSSAISTGAFETLFSGQS